MKSPPNLVININDSKRTRPISDQQLFSQEFHSEVLAKLSPSGSISAAKKEQMLEELYHEANLFNEANRQQLNSSNSSSDTSKNTLLPKSSSSLKFDKKSGAYVYDENVPLKRVRLNSKSKTLVMAEDDGSETEMFINQKDLLYVPKNCAESMEQFAKYVWKNGWKAMPHHTLPSWLRDNEYLLKGHRPPLPSSKECFKSIFRIHTETGNIWTHLIGMLIRQKLWTVKIIVCYFNWFNLQLINITIFILLSIKTEQNIFKKI